MFKHFWFIILFRFVIPKNIITSHRNYMIRWNDLWQIILIHLDGFYFRRLNITLSREIPFSPPKKTIRFSPLFGLRFKRINFSGDFGILMKKSEVEISVFLIIHLPKYHFLHQTKDNPSFDYFDVLVFGILLLNIVQKWRIWIWKWI